MKKGWILIGLLLACLLAAVPAGGEAAAEEDEWTVLFYFCGSDLESRYGYATESLQEIMGVTYPDNFYANMLEGFGLTPDEDLKRRPGKVNVLIETGGSREWHGGDMDMDVDPNALQRWSFETSSVFDMQEYQPTGLMLMETLPLQSMADPETLADFIRWGVAARPARKYALVLWDHGDGARTGLLIDELFDQDVMYLYELGQALRDGGAYFETVIIDACLMANIETAWNIREYARWMVASEETVPGKGTAVNEWLQQLLFHPEGDGEWLGRCVCDATAIKYTNEAEEQFRDILTWSVTDLTGAEALAGSLDEIFRMVDEALLNYPDTASIYIRDLFDMTEYGEGGQHMRDFGSLVYRTDFAAMAPLSMRNGAVQALTDAVAYCVRGPGRSEARGLTFCYPAGFTAAELDIYAKNFPMPWYLAYLDAVSDWTAPDAVYEQAARLPDIDDIPQMEIRMKRQLDADGMPGIRIFADSLNNADKVCYSLYRLNPETGATVRLGRTSCIGNVLDPGYYEPVWRAADPMHWPSVDGELICMDLLEDEGYQKLYNVPVMLDSRSCILRMGRYANYAQEEEARINDYEIYGLWEGYEENSALMNRSARSLSSLIGQEYRMLYPVEGTGGADAWYESSAPLTMYRALDVQEIPLPAGTYYLEYEVDDLLMRRTKVGRIEIRWDGEHMTIPESGTWADDDWIRVADLRQEQGK